jgi:hypothetical protein
VLVLSDATQPFLSSLLDEVEYGDAITNRGKQTCSVWREEQVASAVDGAKKVGELRRMSVSVMQACTRSTHLEVRLHGGLQALFAVKCSYSQYHRRIVAGRPLRHASV